MKENLRRRLPALLFSAAIVVSMLAASAIDASSLVVYQVTGESAEQGSETRHYVDLGELYPEFKGHTFSFVVPAGYEVASEETLGPRGESRACPAKRNIYPIRFPLANFTAVNCSRNKHALEEAAHA